MSVDEQSVVQTVDDLCGDVLAAEVLLVHLVFLYCGQVRARGVQLKLLLEILGV